MTRAERRERRRLRAARFDRLMDRLDGDWRTPARLEQLARRLYMHAPRFRR